MTKFKDEVRSYVEQSAGGVDTKSVVSAFPGKNPASVRGTLNLLVKHGLVVREKRGLYTKRVLPE